jgi:acyl-CoA thioester hydrolase
MNPVEKPRCGAGRYYRGIVYGSRPGCPTQSRTEKEAVVAADATHDSPSGRPLAVGDAHQFDIPMRWGDADVLDHLNNTLYFRMMEEARMQILYGAGLRLPADAGVILAHASCDFLKPVTYPATVRVTHRVARIGRSSLEFDLVLDKVGDDTGSYARSRNVLVWMDYVRNRAEPWPADVLARMGALFTPGG